MISDAIGLERKSKLTGYKIVGDGSTESSPNLPQRIAVFGMANHSHQDSYPEGEKEVTSLKQCGELYGFGSHLYHMFRIMRARAGSIVGGIPTVVYPQAEGDHYEPCLITITPAGTATATYKHTLIIMGRRGVDGVNYDFIVTKGDTFATICAKIADAINNVLGSPVTCSISSPVSDCLCETKWRGDTANEVTIYVDTNGNDAGISYAIDVTQDGSGSPSIADALDAFGNKWNTWVLNGYGTDSDIMDALEEFNGRPDPETPTGRYRGEVMKPFVVITGSTADDPTIYTDGRKLEVTHCIAPAPLSRGGHFEAAANGVTMLARMAQDTPHLDVLGKFYPDMPMPADGDIPQMCDYDFRDYCVKKGCSTVDIVAGKYQMQDFVTTSHPDGEDPVIFAYVRNIMLDLNVRFGYLLLELTHVDGHTIVPDKSISKASKIVKPKMWRQVLNGYAEDLEKRALIASKEYMQANTKVGIGSSNADRFETRFEYQRTGVARLTPTTAVAKFNFGSVQ